MTQGYISDKNMFLSKTKTEIHSAQCKARIQEPHAMLIL